MNPMWVWGSDSHHQLIIFVIICFWIEAIHLSFISSDKQKVLNAKLVGEDTQREKLPWNKTPMLKKSTNIGSWNIGAPNQLFIRGS